MSIDLTNLVTALDLADEYGMRTWVQALLDPEPIAKGTHDPTKKIATPPRFAVSDESLTNGTSLPPPSGTDSTRRRTLRSASPSKASSSARKIATPRRSRKTRGTAGSSGLATAIESAEESSHVPEMSVEPESINGDAANVTNAVKVDIETTTEAALDGGEPIITTHVTVETPANHPDLLITADPQAYLDQAKAAIAEANRLTAGRAAGKKRKAMEILQDEYEEVVEIDSEYDEVDSEPVEVVEQPAKRVRLTEIELRKEKMKRRATLGIAASLAFG